MPDINITVRNKVAAGIIGQSVVCGNSDFVINFDFDNEWDNYNDKTARFIWAEGFEDVNFSGTQCPMPIIANTNSVTIGVYAGELHTTTPATVIAKKSILDGNIPEGGTIITKGAKGDPGVSPAITVTDITGGHRITIVDATHPSTDPITIDVMDGTSSQYEEGDGVKIVGNEISADFNSLDSSVAEIKEGEFIAVVQSSLRLSKKLPFNLFLTSLRGNLKATASLLGLVKPDGTTITVDSSGVISANVSGGTAEDITYDPTAQHTTGSVGAELASLDGRVDDVEDDVTELRNDIVEKLNNNLGATEAGKFLKIGTDGSVITANLPLYQGGVE